MLCCATNVSVGLFFFLLFPFIIPFLKSFHFSVLTLFTLQVRCHPFDGLESVFIPVCLRVSFLWKLLLKLSVTALTLIFPNLFYLDFIISQNASLWLGSISGRSQSIGACGFVLFRKNDHDNDDDDVCVLSFPALQLLNSETKKNLTSTSDPD